MDEQRFFFIDWLRVFSMALIVLCHLVVHSTNNLVIQSGQLFNVGVELFLLISGFLVSLSNGKTKQYYCKRIKRIYIPYFIFLLILATLHILYNQSIWKINWLMLVIGCQGTGVGVLGADHLWFISSLLLCYLFAPITYPVINKVKDFKQVLIFASISVLFLVVLALFHQDWIYTLFSPITF